MENTKNLQRNRKRGGVTKLVLHGSPGCPDIETIVEGAPQATPKCCNKCGGIANLYEVVPKYRGDPGLYGCHCP